MGFGTYFKCESAGFFNGLYMVYQKRSVLKIIPDSNVLSIPLFLFLLLSHCDCIFKECVYDIIIILNTKWHHMFSYW